MQLSVLNPHTPEQPFPILNRALKEPDGLLAVGGCLSPQRLINAYHRGIFPWFSPGEPILWWAPDPRLVLFPEKFNVSHSLKKTVRKGLFTVTHDHAFSQVMQYCAAPRHNQDGTWISEQIQQAYTGLHHQGIAHSIETWSGDELVGGLYGVTLGQVFFGESMFHKKTDASKVAFYYLVQQLISWNYRLIDCQVHTPHLASLGAEKISRQQFSNLLTRYTTLQPVENAWD